MIKSINLVIDNIKEKELDLISQAGFDGLDLGIPTRGEDEWKELFKKLDGILKILEKYNLKCVQIHYPQFPFFLSSELRDEKTEKSIIHSFDCMKELGCKWGALHPRTSFNFDYDAKRGLEDNIRVVSDLLEEAVKRDVGIAVENLPIFPDCPHYRFFTSDYEDHMALIDSFGSDNVGICWDFGHANLMSYDMAKVIGRLGNRIKIIHTHNNFRTGDQHLVPSMGHINWDVIMPALKDTGFDGPLSLEVNAPMKGTEESFYKHCFETACVLEKKFNGEN